MILDAHAHLGHDVVFDFDSTEEGLIDCYNRHGVDGAVVQPFVGRPYIEDTREAHDRIARFCRLHPGRFWGMASINPHFRRAEYDAEARRCVEELGFVALKLTPVGHAVQPSSEDGMHVFETADTLKVPVMVHTGFGFPFSDPINVSRAAERYPDLRIVLAHAGANFFTQQALFIATMFANVFVEPSGSGIEATKALIDALGARRVMFSSDVSVNVPVELAKYRALVSDETELEQVLSGTAIEVFNLAAREKRGSTR